MLLTSRFNPPFYFNSARTRLPYPSNDDRLIIKTALALLDSINHKYEKGNLFIGRQGIQRQWAMARQFKSPNYTTRLTDAPIVKIC